MSVNQEQRLRIKSKHSEQIPSEPIYPLPTDDNQIPNSDRPSWRLFYRWFLTHTFAPQWLPDKWHHPFIGYTIAILLQLIAVFITGLVLHLFPTMTLTGLLEVLVVALVALNWGVGPSLIATLIGAVLLNYVIQTPHYTWTLTESSIAEVFLFLLIGVTISIV
ncbi:MAG TPA: DUF4118 domain-containing protein, partial [Ktedonobacteraceae bacterium]|nr:DUF4118 domain-containing protein [Ktedonobacteraceae bacterium]